MVSATVSLMASTFRVTKQQHDSRIRVAELRNALWKTIISFEEPEDSDITYTEMLTALGEVQTTLLQQVLKAENSPVDSDEDGD